MNDTDNFSVCSVFYQMLCFCCLFIDVSLCNDKSLVFNVSIDEVFIINLAVVYTGLHSMSKTLPSASFTALLHSLDRFKK